VKYVTLLLVMEEKILGFHQLQFCAAYRIFFGHQNTKREPDCSSTEIVITLSVTFREDSSHLFHLFSTFDTSKISKKHNPLRRWGQAPACFIYVFMNGTPAPASNE